LADDFLDAHARLRILRGDAGRGAEIRALRVLAEGKLDRARRVGHRPLGDRVAPFPLHDLALAADRVRGAVQDERAGRAAGELAIAVDVFVREDVANAHHAAVRQRDLVRASLDGGVAVRVDDAGHHELAGGVDDGRAGGRLDLIVCPDRRDLRAADEEGAVLDLAVRDGEDGGVADENDVFGERRCRDGCECNDQKPFHFDLLPLNGSVPSVVETVPLMAVPDSVPWKTQSSCSACPFTLMVNSSVVPSNVPPRISPEPRSPENDPVTWPFSPWKRAL